MKTSFLSVLVISVTLAMRPSQRAMADDNTLSGQSISSADTTGTNAAGDGQGQRLERLKEVLAQLDLTDAQKTQIQQIRSTVPAGHERRQEILAVLTPDQKTKLRELIQAHRNAAQSGTNTSSTGQ